VCKLEPTLLLKANNPSIIGIHPRLCAAPTLPAVGVVEALVAAVAIILRVWVRMLVAQVQVD
jgi:hypothetical protein